MIARYSGAGLELDNVIASLAPLQRDLIRSMLFGDDEPADTQLALLHRITLIELRRLRIDARARVRELLGLSRRSLPGCSVGPGTAKADLSR